MNSKVYLVGAGAGDPSLITKKGLDILKKCDTVIYDKLASPTLLLYLKPACKRIYAGKISGKHSMTQDEINRILLEEAGKCSVTVRLKGGDPYVFGRGGEEALMLKEHNIPYEVINGVSSAIAVPASAGIPVTHRGISQSFHVITGHTADGKSEPTENFYTLARLNGTLVFLMGLSNLKLISEELIKNGKSKDTPVAVISNGTLAHRVEVRGILSNIVKAAAESGIKSPAIITVGDTSALNFLSDKKPILSAIKVGISGTLKFYKKLSSLLAEEGAEVIPVNPIRIININLPELVKEINDIKKYSWICLTSPNGVDVFFKTLLENSVDFRIFASVKFAVIGHSTANELKKYGFCADLIPDIFTGKELAEKLSCIMKENDNILIARSSKGFEILTDILSQHNIKYKDLKIYDTQSDRELAEDILENSDHVDFMVFASPYGVESFFNISKSKEIVKNAKIIAIGETTANALKEYAINSVVADPFTAEGITDIIISEVLNEKIQKT